MEVEKLTYSFSERILRLLVTQGWFREPSQGYFANNRLSNLIKKNQATYHIATYMLVFQGVLIFSVFLLFQGMVFSPKSPQAFRR
jgi:hypothetical protein